VLLERAQQLNRIGGAPAAAVVLSRQVSARTDEDPRVTSLRALLTSATGKALAEVHHELAEVTQAVRAEKLKQVADEFDSIHDIRRAMRVGSVDHIISPEQLRPFVIRALERRLAARVVPEAPATVPGTHLESGAAAS
jgi:50S ribosomal subunit-associated GTPase HflX